MAGQGVREAVVRGPLKAKGSRTPVARVVAYLVLSIYGLVCLFPFLWAFLVSLAPLTRLDPATNLAAGVDIMQWPPRIDLLKGTVFGAAASLQNYVKIFEVVPSLARWILNTVVYAGVVTTGNLLFTTVAGYAFARLRFPLRDVWFTLFLFSLMVPFHVTMIPVYNLLVRIRFVDTYAGLLIPKLVTVSLLFLMRQFFVDFPRALEEAARIDGASIPRTAFQIVFPNARAPLAAQGIYIFLGSWNEFLWPLIATSSKDMYTLTMGLNFFRASYYMYWQYMMAASLLVTIPMIVIFLVFQRQFIGKGALAGSIKE